MDLQRINRGMENGAEAIQANFEKLAGLLENIQTQLSKQSQDSLTVVKDINVGGSVKAKANVNATDVDATVYHFMKDGKSVASLRYEPSGYAGAGLYMHDSKGDHKL